MVALVTVGYSNWRERAKGTLLVTFPALLLCLLLDFVGGGVLGANFDRIAKDFPLLLVILPGMMDLRGNVFGAMASRMTTALRLGRIEGVFDEEVTTNITMAIVSSKIPLLVLGFVGIFKVGLTHSALVVIAVVIASALLIGLILGYSTALITIFPYRHGIDPDTIAAPLITSIADVITIPSLVYILFFYGNHPKIFFVFLAVMFLLLIILAIRSSFTEEKRRAFREISFVLSTLALIELISGSTLEHYSHVISAVLILSVMYPSILDSTGNFASIVAASTSTRLNLTGVEALRERNFIGDVMALLMLTPLIGFLTNWFAVKVAKFAGINGGIIPIFVITYPFLVLLGILSGVGVAYLAYKLSLDPDNVAVPAVTTLTDVMGTIYLVLIAHAIL